MYRLPPWHRNELSRLIKSPKAHFLDSGLLAALTRQTVGRLRADRTALGSIVECHVLSELLKHATWWDDDLTLSYYRDKDQYEVDFVLENAAANIVGIETKSAATVQTADFRGLRRLEAASGTAFVQGIVLYTGSTIVNFGPRMRAVPIGCMWI
jgi:predicted AAA+ superfamily ATPase